MNRHSGIAQDWKGEGKDGVDLLIGEFDQTVAFLERVPPEVGIAADIGDRDHCAGEAPAATENVRVANDGAWCHWLSFA